MDIAVTYGKNKKNVTYYAFKSYQNENETEYSLEKIGQSIDESQAVLVTSANQADEGNTTSDEEVKHFWGQS